MVNEENEKHEWRPANRKEFMLDKEGIEQSDKDNVERFLKSLGMMEATEKKLRLLIRETIILEERRTLKESMVGDAVNWISKKGPAGLDSFKKFLKNLKQELQETHRGTEILVAIARGKDLTQEDVKFVKGQIKDIALGSALLGIFMLPGGGLIGAALLKVASKVGINLLPSAFGA